MAERKSYWEPKWYSRSRRRGARALNRSAGTQPTSTTSSEQPSPAPPATLSSTQDVTESWYWVSHNRRFQLEPDEEFSLPVMCWTAPGPYDYVRLTLQRAVPNRFNSRPDQFQDAWGGQLGGSTAQRWNGRRSLMFKGLKIKWPGEYRFKVDFMDCDGELPGTVVKTLYSGIYHRKLVTPERWIR